MKEIPLTQGQVALVDDEDYEELSRYKWQAVWMPGTHGFYAMRTVLVNGKRNGVLMHRVIMGAQPGEEVDHRDHNTLNDRRYNLRWCSHAENQYNRKPSAGCSSTYKGVCWHKQHRKWCVRIMKDGHRQHIGLFTNERNAALAYDVRARELFGEFALTNF